MLLPDTPTMTLPGGQRGQQGAKGRTERGGDSQAQVGNN